LAAFRRADADADEDDEFFDPSDFDEEDARSLFLSGAAAAPRLDEDEDEDEDEAATAAATTSMLSRPIPPFALLVALHSQDAIYLLEGDNVGGGEYPPECCASSHRENAQRDSYRDCSESGHAPSDENIDGTARCTRGQRDDKREQ